MKKVIKIILDFLKPKCPDCNHPMDNISEYFGSQVYSCDKCKKEWF
jgi:transposase-like protein